MSQQLDQPDVEYFLKELQSDRAKRRESTCRRITEREIKDERVLRKLEELAASDPVAYVREAASKALIKFGYTPPRPKVLAASSQGTTGDNFSYTSPRQPVLAVSSQDKTGAKFSVAWYWIVLGLVFAGIVFVVANPFGYTGVCYGFSGGPLGCTFEDYIRVGIGWGSVLGAIICLTPGVVLFLILATWNSPSPKQPTDSTGGSVPPKKSQAVAMFPSKRNPDE